jgi:hypothetical protein
MCMHDESRIFHETKHKAGHLPQSNPIESNKRRKHILQWIQYWDEFIFWDPTIE